MKRKVIKASLLTIFLILLTIFGVFNLVRNFSNAEEGTSTSAKPGTLMAGEDNPSTYSYNTNFGTWIYKDYNHQGAAYNYIPWYDSSDSREHQIYCIQPDVHIRYNYEILYTDPALTESQRNPQYLEHAPIDYPKHAEYYIYQKENVPASKLQWGTDPENWYYTGNTKYNGNPIRTPIKWKPTSTNDLSPAQAYIVSEYNSVNGGWTWNKQKAIWNLKDTGLEGSISIGENSSGKGGSSYLDQQAADYADYHSKVEPKNGLDPKNTTNVDAVTVKVDQSSKEYTVGELELSYTNGIYGNIAFSGISDMRLGGYNVDGTRIKSITIKQFLIDGKKVTPKYFKPDSKTKIDKASNQKYPMPDEKFEVVFDDPNAGVDVSDLPNRVAFISLEVDFQYMLAYGEYTYYEGWKTYLSYDHEDTPKRYIEDSKHLTCTKHVHNGGCYSKKWVTDESEAGGHYETTKTCTQPDHTHSIADRCYQIHFDCKKNERITKEEHNQQDVICANAIRSIYEQDIGKGDGKILIDITMDIEGKVWEDEKAGKESLADGQRQDSEKPVNNIPVILYDDEDKVVDSKTTDGKGEYKFEQLDAMRKYYVEFKYNGQQYENTIYTDKLDDKHSIATETTTDRDSFNKKFEEIDGDEGYTVEQLTYEDGKRAQYYNAPGIFTLSAYTGSDGKDDLVKYPKHDVFVLEEVETTVAGKKYKAVYDDEDSIKHMDFGITQRIEFDMALKKDLYVATVKINGKTEVYGYDKRQIDDTCTDAEKEGTAQWTISVVGGYERGLDDADWNFNGENGNKDGLLEVYATYKVAVRNQSMSMLGHVTKLYDYYDSTYEYQPDLSWQSSKNYKTNKDTLDKLQDSMEKGTTSDFGSSPKATDDKNGTLTVDVNKKQETGETQYIYLTFKIKNDSNGRVSLGEKKNKAEIGAFKTYYKGGKTTLPHYNGENSYKVTDDNMIAGRVDRDSIPSSMGKDGEPGKNYLGDEDDEDKAPGLDVKLTGDKRKLNGTVWEDERKTSSGNAMIGDGIMDKNETKIAGVKVELVEKTVWDKQNPTGEFVWVTTRTDKDGTYEFDSYIPGDYVVRFDYSEDSLYGKNKNDGKSYNGQDYKSTTYQAGITQTATTDLDGKYKGYNDVNNQNETGTYGYNIATKKENVSDAKDIWSVRDKVNQYSNNYGKGVTNGLAEILASPYQTPSYNGTSYTDDEMKALLDELIKNTKMTAESGVVVVEVERNMQSNLENGNPSYSIENLNLGLVERPKAQLEIDKSITNIKVTLANSTVLFDVNKAGDNVIWKDHTEYNLASHKKNNKYEEYYGKSGKNRYSYREEVDNIVRNADKGLVQLTMDEELMHGATIEITYQVKVTNVGEVDYEGQKFYYTGDNSGASIVTTSANTVVDYVANNLQFNSNDSRNKGWSVVTKDVLTTQNLVNSRLTDQINKFNTIIETAGLDKELIPGASTTKTLVLSQLITAENKSDDLTYSNMVEIVKTSNTVGRRMAYSVVGNQDPTASKAAEVDASIAEKVIILPPFGEKHIFYILGAVIGIILIGGITFIIRKVLKK